MNMQDEVICDFLVTARKKRINAVYLDLLREFGRLCGQAGLTWWLYAGALIGAARHKGFIPWDDDVDLLMPRADFDRLQAMTNAGFGAEEPYFLQNFVTDPGCAQSLIRFRRSDTTGIRDYDLGYLRTNPGREPYNMGINLAVFPLDAWPAGRLARRLQPKIAYAVRGIFYRATLPDEAKPVQHALCLVLYRLIGGTNMMKLIHWLYRAPRRVDPSLVQSFEGLYPGMRLVWPREDFAETAELPFEDISVPVPVGWDDLLRTTYGSYMEFPPEEQRVEEQHCGYTDADTPYAETLARLKREGLL